MKTLLVLSLLSPLSTYAASPWGALDGDPSSPTSLRAPEAPRPILAKVLADADPLRAPSGSTSGAEPTGSGHTDHHGHHGSHGGTAPRGVAEGQGARQAGPGGHDQHTGHGQSADAHAGHGQHTSHGEHTNHDTSRSSAPHAGHGTEKQGTHSGAASDAGTPAPAHGHHH